MTAPRLLERLPCSVELPAGGGKTWLLVDAVRRIADTAGKTLVLTHTHAGVHSIHRKMRDLGVGRNAAHVGTITSLAFELVRSYPRIAGLSVPENPDWEDSTLYVTAASNVLRNRHIRNVFEISYTHLMIDEYQDCSLAQHGFVRALVEAIPSCAVFGDRLQGIFGFRDPIVDWTADVLPVFPALEVEFVPRRWVEHNTELGDWLFQLRDQLTPGSLLRFDTGLPHGVTFVASTPQQFELRTAARLPRGPGETVVVIAPPDATTARTIANRLSGLYTTMEDIGGNFMAAALSDLESLSPPSYALWLAQLAKQCFSGYSNLKFDTTVINRYKRGKTASDLPRPGLTRTLASLDDVIANPTYETMSESMSEIRRAREGRLHSREAWNDIATALEYCAADATRLPIAELGRVRDRFRYSGRPPLSRVVSRTALIKGLEYDHVIIANLQRIADQCNLYVALSRARKSLTIIGQTSTITVGETSRSPRTITDRTRRTTRRSTP